jgi:alpha-1,6-mannosyltransferase
MKKRKSGTANASKQDDSASAAAENARLRALWEQARNDPVFTSSLLKDVPEPRRNALAQFSPTWGLDVLFAGIVIFHVIYAPFTKVEESFNVQAMHDLLFHGLDISAYDHHEFPGVVPRTFVGALVTALPVWPFVTAGVLSRLHALYACRIVLALYLSLAWSFLRWSIRRHYGYVAAVAFAFFSMVQFHVPFYMSRPLPNTFALGLTMFATGLWIRNRISAMVSFLAFAAVVFRAEIAVFALPVLLSELLFIRSISFGNLLRSGFTATLLSVLLTVVIDSVFWQRWLWPEWEVFHYNTVLNKSSNWGTSPFSWYFTSAVPRAMTGIYLLLPLGLYFQRHTMVRFFGPAFLFVLLYSFLPHKELRFILYAVPIFTMVASVGFAHVWVHDRTLFIHVSICVVMATAMATAGFGYVSMHNYPGGHALMHLHQSRAQYPGLIHMDTSATMTGVSRFLEQPELGWKYSKDESVHDFSQAGYDYLLSGKQKVPGFELLFAEEGFDRLDVHAGKVRFANKVFVHQVVHP